MHSNKIYFLYFNLEVKDNINATFLMTDREMKA